MNLSTLGHTLGELYAKHGEKLPEPARKMFADVVNLADVIDEGIEEFFGAFNAAAGIVDPADEPGADGTPGYHCHSCKMNDAAVEDLGYTEKTNYIADNHPKGTVRAWAERILATHDTDKALQFLEFYIDKWFIEARKVDNPNVWDDVTKDN